MNGPSDLAACSRAEMVTNVVVVLDQTGSWWLLRLLLWKFATAIINRPTIATTATAGLDGTSHTKLPTKRQGMLPPLLVEIDKYIAVMLDQPALLLGTDGIGLLPHGIGIDQTNLIARVQHRRSPSAGPWCC